MRQYSSDIAFTPSVKAIQTAKGSRFNYERMELGGGWETAVTPDLESFLADLDMFYLGTANAEGQPYIQYRGGSPGFLKVVDEKDVGVCRLWRQSSIHHPWKRLGESEGVHLPDGLRSQSSHQALGHAPHC